MDLPARELIYVFVYTINLAASRFAEFSQCDQDLEIGMGFGIWFFVCVVFCLAFCVL
jgi:hypothetical protein